MLRWLIRIVLAAGLLILLASVLGSFSPLFDLANLVVVPVAIVSIAAAVVLAIWARGRIAKGALIAAALTCGLLLIPPADDPAQCAADAPRIRIAWLNAHGTDDAAPIIAWLQAEQPDAVGFAELGNGSQTVRDAVLALYPHRQTCLANQRCSTVIYVRDEPLSAEPLGYGNPHNRTGLSATRVTLAAPGATAGDAPLNLMAVHLSRPLPLGDQRAELASVNAQIRQPADTVIIGDFNMTRRMKALSGFAAANGLTAAATDRPTWPLFYGDQSTVPLLQIDHLLLGRNWTHEGVRTSPDLGSDHRGFVADICRKS